MRYCLIVLSLILSMGTSSLVYADTKVYFSPKGGCQEAVISEIKEARRSIDIAMFEFTSRSIAQALIQAHEQGVKVRVDLDKSQIKELSSKSRYLISKGIDVKFHMGAGLMHNKFAVIDGRSILTGSFNWTASAEKKNVENLLIIKDRALGGKYEKEFKRLWSQSGVGIKNQAG